MFSNDGEKKVEIMKYYLYLVTISIFTINRRILGSVRKRRREGKNVAASMETTSKPCIYRLQV